MVVVLDRIYVAVLILFVTCCAVNVRIALERPRLLRQMAGYLHVLACIISGVGGMIMAANEIFAWGLCQQLHFGCASAHVGKIFNHIINFTRLDSVSRFDTGTRIGFGTLMLAKAAAASCHCTFFQPTLIEDQKLCLPKLELVSTDFTYGMEVVIDVVFTVLFMKKLYDHLDQFRDGMQNAAESAVKPIYRQFFFEVIPFMLISIVMNSFILSGHFGIYSICFIYLDFAFALRVTNDLIFMSRLSQPDNLWANGPLGAKFGERAADYGGTDVVAMSVPSARRSMSSEESTVHSGKEVV